MEFNFKNYFDIVSFEFNVDVNIDITQYHYVRFASPLAQKAIFDYYKNEMQQGNSITTPNIGYSYIKQTGFFDLFPQKASWTKFKNQINPIVLYLFEIRDGVVWLSPVHINKNNDIYRAHYNEILEL